MHANLHITEPFFKHSLQSKTKPYSAHHTMQSAFEEWFPLKIICWIMYVLGESVKVEDQHKSGNHNKVKRHREGVDGRHLGSMSLMLIVEPRWRPDRYVSSINFNEFMTIIGLG